MTQVANSGLYSSLIFFSKDRFLQKTPTCSWAGRDELFFLMELPVFPDWILKKCYSNADDQIFQFKIIYTYYSISGKQQNLKSEVLSSCGWSRWLVKMADPVGTWNNNSTFSFDQSSSGILYLYVNAGYGICSLLIVQTHAFPVRTCPEVQEVT